MKLLLLIILVCGFCASGQKQILLKGKYSIQPKFPIKEWSYEFVMSNVYLKFYTDGSGYQKSGTYSITNSNADSALIVFHFMDTGPSDPNRKEEEFKTCKMYNIKPNSFILQTDLGIAKFYRDSIKN